MIDPIDAIRALAARALVLLALDFVELGLNGLRVEPIAGRRSGRGLVVIVVLAVVSPGRLTGLVLAGIRCGGRCVCAWGGGDVEIACAIVAGVSNLAGIIAVVVTFVFEPGALFVGKEAKILVAHVFGVHVGSFQARFSERLISSKR